MEYWREEVQDGVKKLFHLESFKLSGEIRLILLSRHLNLLLITCSQKKYISGRGVLQIYSLEVARSILLHVAGIVLFSHFQRESLPLARPVDLKGG